MTDKTDKPKSVVILHLTKPERFGSQTRLAEAAGVKPHTISGKSKTDNPLSLKQMHRILVVAPDMGVNVDAWDFFPDLKDATQDAERAA